MSKRRMTEIGFFGGVGSVTGANFLFNTGDAKFLIDCGLVQGDQFAKEENYKSFPYNPAEIDVLLVTHAHADHIGRIPKLVRDGFAGVIYSTEPTKDLAKVMLEDAYRVMSYESEKYGRDPLYSPENTKKAFKMWKTIPYDTEHALPDDVTCILRNAGHILGSSTVELSRGGKRMLFTGDLGNVPQPLLNPPVVPTGYDYLLMESVYGDRVHEEVAHRSTILLSCIEDTIKKKGTLIIPAFSLERTQAMLFEINNFVEQGVIEPIPTFLDSPLAIRVTELYRQHVDALKTEVQEQIKGGDDIFDFPKLSFTETRKASDSIAKVKGPKIIIAGSGMSHGGRILGHEQRYLEDPTTTLLLVGYQTVGSIGRILEDGAKHVTINGTKVKVRAKIERIRGYSGHADRDQLMAFVEAAGDTLKEVFVTMGEEKASLFLVQRLRDYFGVDAWAPEQGDFAEIEF